MTLTDRIWTAHPLLLAHRAVLLAIARQIPDGRSEVLVNRTGLARDLETNTDTIRRSLIAGEAIGLCQVHRNGVVAFSPVALPGLAPGMPRASEPSVREAPPQPVDDRLTVRGVQALFAKGWEGKYHQRYVFEHPKDDRLASSIARALSPDEAARRLRNYLTHPDPFYSRCTHSFGMWVSRINDFAVAKTQDDPYTYIEEQARARRQAR